MADKYGTGQDPDCYPGTDILINLLGIRDAQIREDAERDITVIRADEVEFLPPPILLANSVSSIRCCLETCILGPET